MCHAVRVKLSAAEAREVTRFYGRLVPIYASIALLFVAAMAFSSSPRPGEPVAVAANATARR